MWSNKLLVGLLVAFGVSCASGSVGGRKSGGSSIPVKCGSEERIMLDCESEITFDTQKYKGGFSAVGFAGAHFETERTALRQVDEATTQYIVGWRRLCEEYNKCVIDKDTYSTRSENLRRRTAKVPELIEAFRGAVNPKQRAMTLATAYESLVPVEQQVGIELSFSLKAKKPGESSFSTVAAGASLPSETRMYFSVTPSKPVYLYLYQQAPNGEVTVLFPDSRIELKNPIAAKELRVPSGEVNYKVNEKDIGTERIYLAASLQPLAKLEAALNTPQVTAEKDRTIAQLATVSRSDDCAARALELDTTPNDSAKKSCPRPRGVELDAPSNSTKPSLRAKSEAADGVIVQVFQFEHTR